MTVKLHKINPRTWLLAYLQACCDAQPRTDRPADLPALDNDGERVGSDAGMPDATSPTIEGVDTS